MQCSSRFIQFKIFVNLRSPWVSMGLPTLRSAPWGAATVGRDRAAPWRPPRADAPLRIPCSWTCAPGIEGSPQCIRWLEPGTSHQLASEIKINWILQMFSKLTGSRKDVTIWGAVSCCNHDCSGAAGSDYKIRNMQGQSTWSSSHHRDLGWDSPTTLQDLPWESERSETTKSGENKMQQAKQYSSTTESLLSRQSLKQNSKAAEAIWGPFCTTANISLSNLWAPICETQKIRWQPLKNLQVSRLKKCFKF